MKNTKIWKLEIEFYNLVEAQAKKKNKKIKCNYFVNKPLFITYCDDGNMGLNSIDKVIRSPRKVFPERILPASANSSYTGFKGFPANGRDSYSSIAFTTT